MAEYIVGNIDKTWNFDSALLAAKDGDTILLEENFTIVPKNTRVVIDKNITIQGNAKITDDKKSTILTYCKGASMLRKGRRF